MVLVLVVVLPVGILMLAGAATALFGAGLNKHSDEVHTDHELSPLNR